MPIPPDFVFSQHSLQDYADCPRRFSLRYLQRLAWPAIEAEPVLENERQMRIGSQFHLMVHQQFLGVPPERLSRMASEADLRMFWGNYLDSLPGSVPGKHYPEKALSMPLAGYSLTAKYDLVVVSPEGRAVIFDWKTSDRLPRREWLTERWQTRVYRYVLFHAGQILNDGRAFAPEDIEFVYWYAGFPDQPVRLAYNPGQAAQDDDRLQETVREIAGREDFPLTTDVKRCAFCPYRSYCERGEAAGDVADLQEALESKETRHIDFDFDQIVEVEF